MEQTKRDHRQTNSLINIFQRFRTACHHVFDGSCRQWNVKLARQDFMRTADTVYTNGVESYNHCMKVFALLDSGLYVFRK